MSIKEYTRMTTNNAVPDALYQMMAEKYPKLPSAMKVETPSTNTTEQEDPSKHWWPTMKKVTMQKSAKPSTNYTTNEVS